MNTLTLVLSIVLAIVFALAVTLTVVLSRRNARLLNEKSALLSEKAMLQAVVTERTRADENLRNTIREMQENTRKADEERHRKDLEQMKDSFKALSAENSAEFKRRSSEDLAQLLKPIHEKFEEFDKSVKEAGIRSTEQSAKLGGVIEQMLKQTQDVAGEARNLADALSGRSKVQGDFGEMVLTDILRNAGLTEGIHFIAQGVIKDEQGHEIKSDAGGTLIPDVLIYYPDDSLVVVDSKVTLTAYRKYFESQTAEDRKRYADETVASIKKHVEELRGKDYAAYIPSGKTKIDYNIMFIPVEGAFQLMLDTAPRLWQEARNNNVMIVSQMTLLIVLNMISMSWKQHDQVKNIEAVYKTASEMMAQIKGWLDSFVKIGDSLDKARSAYDEANRKLSASNQSVIRKIEKLEKDYSVSVRKSGRGKLDITSRKTGPESIIPKQLTPQEDE